MHKSPLPRPSPALQRKRKTHGSAPFVTVAVRRTSAAGRYSDRVEVGAALAELQGLPAERLVDGGQP